VFWVHFVIREQKCPENAPWIFDDLIRLLEIGTENIYEKMTKVANSLWAVAGPFAAITVTFGSEGFAACHNLTGSGPSSVSFGNLGIALPQTIRKLTIN
jgi:hypothetical protein